MSEGSDILDHSVLDTLKGLRPGFLENLVDMYIQDSPNQLVAINEAIDSGNPRALEESAHAIKSSSRSLGVLSVADVAGKLEQLGESGQVAGAVELFATLKDSLDSAHEALRAECA